MTNHERGDLSKLLNKLRGDGFTQEDTWCGAVELNASFEGSSSVYMEDDGIRCDSYSNGSGCRQVSCQPDILAVRCAKSALSDVIEVFRGGTVVEQT